MPHREVLPMTPTQRSLAKLRAEGWVPYVVERWNPFAHIRQDLYGFIDIVAIKSGNPGVLAIQTTTTDNIQSRITKSKENPNLSIWLSGGNKFKVWGWAKRGDRGKRKLWELKEIEILPDGGIMN